MNATFIAGTMPRVSGIIMRRGSDISPYKGMGKEGKVKERRERERERKGRKERRRRISLPEQGRRLVLAAKA